MFISPQFNHRALAVRALLGTAQRGSLLETRAVGFQAIPQQFLDLVTLDSTCLQVLQQTVNCDDTVAGLGQREYHGSLGDVKLTDAVCAASCKMALTTARRRIAGACTKTPELLPGMTILSYIDSITTGWNETCLKDDTSGQYCNERILTVELAPDIIDSWEEVENIEDMPETELCSYCYGAKLRLMQTSEYSVYDEDYAAMLDYVNKDSPTTPVKLPPQNNGTQPGTCSSGKKIVTKQGDSCDSIALANSVSGASLYYINPNLPDCKSIEAGVELCLPQTCATHTVQEGETCVEVGVGAGISWMNLVDWNPMLDARCSNLWNGEPFWGHVICVSPPGGDFEDGGSGNDDGETGNGNSGGEGGSGNGYSDTIVDPPDGEIGQGTTKSCGFYVQAQQGVSCAKMIVAASRSSPMDLFLQVNPSLGTAAECDSKLKVGVWYCLSPYYYWANGQPKPTTTATATATTTAKA
ncbi:LysM domain-containing protein [Trichoderma cornu-damae]|uniref:LysM domain-containing protein n=1 Tax=Trichoderma cornu-damae TaxID=654480 RepID=A0A9P8QL24_9HYPO|nr:LysM domain-containing protein [Trichoderma cornu-damae]